MTLSANARRDAALRDLDPLPPAPPDLTDRQERKQQNVAWLLALAVAHPRTERPAAPSDTRPAARLAARRGAVALAIALTGLVGGGVAVATTGAWDRIASSWNDMTGHDPRHAAAAPRLVARGTGTTSASSTGSIELQLWSAATADGGQCQAVRSTGFSLDTCRGGQDAPATTALTHLNGRAYFQVSYTSRADYLWGRVDPQQVTTVRLSAPDREPFTTTVDRATGYWTTSIIDTNTTSTLTLTLTDAAGHTLLAHTVTR